MGIRGRRVSSQVLLDRTQARDVLQVLVVALGEGVSAGAVGYEIEFLVRAGLAAASIEARPGLAIGPGGKPSMT